MIRQRDLWREMYRMQRRIDRMFGNGWGRRDKYKMMLDEFSAGYRKAFSSFKENDKEYLIQIELPGIEKEDIKLNIIDNSIEIRAQKKEVKEEANKEGKSFSKKFSGFYQVFDAPSNADLSNIDASYKNGVLVLRLPKKEKSENRKEIKIN